MRSRHVHCMHHDEYEEDQNDKEEEEEKDIKRAGEWWSGRGVVSNGR